MRSSTSPPRTSTPDRAARPMANEVASGVAIPSAHGQATTSTASAANPPFAGPSASAQNSPAAAASASTAGTKTAAMRSATRSDGVLLARASSTMAMMRRSKSCSPTRSAWTINPSLPLTVPAITSSPGPKTRGCSSPVNAACSIMARPSRMRPSAGIRSPGRMRTWSPARKSPMGTSRGPSDSIFSAVRGSRVSRLRTSCAVRDFAVPSMSFPNVTRVGSMVAVSK